VVGAGLVDPVVGAAVVVVVVVGAGLVDPVVGAAVVVVVAAVVVAVQFGAGGKVVPNSQFQLVITLKFPDA
jgi:hypothetical protein